jgi:hypothetical protein
MTVAEINILRRQTFILARAMRDADRVSENLSSACQWLDDPASDPGAIAAAEAAKAFVVSIKAIVDEAP